MSPAFGSRNRPGEIHGAVPAQRTPGCGLGAGPTAARLFRAHSTPSGGARKQWGANVPFTVPGRKRMKHVWTYWSAVSGQLRPALAAQHRLGKQGRRPNPVRAVVRVEARGVA